ncbi:hypothetical protein OGATHE_000741 [Ogataea polymorpha]|uniref:Uncharacterized protein n=1 Tax=Ogataea polymorpha TaxID=460523 RepID=A0A9P8PTP3_9ASCO|nr:hypothetical protein OGATHE_000741 [Ogataea polymorpha]
MVCPVKWPATTNSRVPTADSFSKASWWNFATSLTSTSKPEGSLTSSSVGGVLTILLISSLDVFRVLVTTESKTCGPKTYGGQTVVSLKFGFSFLTKSHAAFSA